jgi:hypothetical protein
MSKTLESLTKFVDGYSSITVSAKQIASVNREVDARIAELTAEVEALRVALKFYANDTNWSSSSVMERGPAVNEDSGDIARSTLKKEK